MHGTRAALPVVTALLGSGESNSLTDAIEERRTRVDAKLAVLAVDAQRDRDCALDVRAVRSFCGRGALHVSAASVRRHRRSNDYSGCCTPCAPKEFPAGRI